MNIVTKIKNTITNARQSIKISVGNQSFSFIVCSFDLLLQIWRTGLQICTVRLAGWHLFRQWE